MDSKFKALGIFVPGKDSGLSVLGSENLYPDFARQSDISAIISPSDKRQQMEIISFIDRYRNFRLANKTILFKSVPALVENYTTDGRTPKVNGKYLLSGAGMLRTLSKLTRKIGPEEVKCIFEYALELGKEITDVSIKSELITSNYKSLPFIIEAKNFFNFYHFTTESFIYLQMYKDYNFNGEIKFVTGSKSEKKPFINELVFQFYPELFDKVEFVQGSLRAERAIIPYNTNFLYHIIPSIKKLVNSKAVFPDQAKPLQNNGPIHLRYKIIYNNSRDIYVDRHVANRKTISSMDFVNKYIYVGRKPGMGKNRALENEGKLKRMLESHGFQFLYFEDYSPLEQADICSKVAIMVSAHGAGFANMMYAKKGSYFIELSHLQTALHRFGDFNMHASVSQAKYVHFFTDHAIENKSETPSMKDGHAGISLSVESIKRLEGFIAIIKNEEKYQLFIDKLNSLYSDNRFHELSEFSIAHPAYLNGSFSACLLTAEAELLNGKAKSGILFLNKALKISPYKGARLSRLGSILNSMGLHDEEQRLAKHQERYKKFDWMNQNEGPDGSVHLIPKGLNT